MKNIEIKPYHHVYSSLGGYKTLYVSRDLPPKMRELAEDVATKIYSIVTKEQVYLTFL